MTDASMREPDAVLQLLLFACWVNHCASTAAEWVLLMQQVQRRLRDIGGQSRGQQTSGTAHPQQ